MTLNCTATPTALGCQVTGLSQLGTDLGGFLTGITPGVIGFIVVLAIIGGIIAIIMAVAHLIKKKMK